MADDTYSTAGTYSTYGDLIVLDKPTPPQQSGQSLNTSRGALLRQRGATGQTLYVIDNRGPCKAGVARTKEVAVHVLHTVHVWLNAVNF